MMSFCLRAAASTQPRVGADRGHGGDDSGAHEDGGRDAIGEDGHGAGGGGHEGHGQGAVASTYQPISSPSVCARLPCRH